MKLSDLTEEFCDYSTYMRGYSTYTIRRYGSVVTLLQRRAGITRLEECTPDVVRQFFWRGRVERHWSTNTFITYHKSLVVFFRWCVARRHLASSPIDGLEVPKLEKALPKRLSEQEAMRLLEIARNYPHPFAFQRLRNHALVATLLYAGLRRQEVMNLHLSDVDCEGRTILVRRGKGNKDRYVPMNPDLRAILSGYVDGRGRLGKTCPEFFVSLHRDMGFSDTGVKRLMADLGLAFGKRLGCHQLRHTFATLMLEGGCDIFALSRMMGHSDIKTTTIYLAASARHLREQIGKHPLSKGQWLR